MRFDFTVVVVLHVKSIMFLPRGSMHEVAVTCRVHEGCWINTPTTRSMMMLPTHDRHRATRVSSHGRSFEGDLVQKSAPSHSAQPPAPNPGHAAAPGVQPSSYLRQQALQALLLARRSLLAEPAIRSGTSRPSILARRGTVPTHQA